FSIARKNDLARIGREIEGRRAAKAEQRRVIVARRQILRLAAFARNYEQVRWLAAFERISVAIERQIRDDECDFTALLGLAELCDAIYRLAIWISIGCEREHRAVRRPDEFADAFGNAGDLARTRSVGAGYEDLRRAVARRKKGDPFAVRRPSRREII